MNDKSRTERRLLASIRHAKSGDASTAAADVQQGSSSAPDATETPGSQSPPSPSAQLQPGSQRSRPQRKVQRRPVARAATPKPKGAQTGVSGYQSPGRVWPD